MTQTGWSPWKLTVLGTAVVIVALSTGLVVASRTGTEREQAAAEPAARPAEPAVKPGRLTRTVPATPSKSAIEACNRYAALEAGAGKDAPDDTIEIVSVGAGTLYGLNDTRKSDDRYRAAYAGCMRSRGYAS
jgi:hypothetical protein